MEILKFENQNWKEIPQQDNPTWDYMQCPTEGKIRRNESIIVCKGLPYETVSTGSSGYVVIHVPISGDIIRKGLFWCIKDAEIFASALINQPH